MLWVIKFHGEQNIGESYQMASNHLGLSKMLLAEKMKMWEISFHRIFISTFLSYGASFWFG